MPAVACVTDPGRRLPPGGWGLGGLGVRRRRMEGRWGPAWAEVPWVPVAVTQHAPQKNSPCGPRTRWPQHMPDAGRSWHLTESRLPPHMLCLPFINAQWPDTRLLVVLHDPKTCPRLPPLACRPSCHVPTPSAVPFPSLLCTLPLPAALACSAMVCAARLTYRPTAKTCHDRA